MASTIFLRTTTIAMLVKISLGVKAYWSPTCRNVFPLMTHGTGSPVHDKTSTMTVGPRGPIVLQDFTLMEELAHFSREKIPQRIAFDRGAGAFGYFEVTSTSFTKYCKASVFQDIGKKTEIFTRLSLSYMKTAPCDTYRGPRGTAIKFYTDDGNFDLVGLNVPVFGIRDPILLPSFIHAMSKNPGSHLSDPDMFWDFVTLRPETAYMVLVVFSDLGIPNGYRHMDMFGVHIYKVVNKHGKAFYSRFHFKSKQGLKNLSSEQGTRLCGSDPDYATRDLYNNIKDKNYPSWTMYYQIMTFDQAAKYKWNPFDVTKDWPQDKYPLHEIGTLVLNENPTNYFAQVEQSAFSPSHLVPGIEPSPDKMLQARLFGYPDAHRYRLGVNNRQLPINRPRVPVRNNYRDGQMCFGDNQGDLPNYYPNSDPRGAQVCPAAAENVWSASGDVKRYNTDREDNFSQVSMFYKGLDKSHKKRIVANLIDSLSPASEKLQKRALLMFSSISPELATELLIGLKKLRH